MFLYDVHVYREWEGRISVMGCLVGLCIIAVLLPSLQAVPCWRTVRHDGSVRRDSLEDLCQVSGESIAVIVSPYWPGISHAQTCLHALYGDRRTCTLYCRCVQGSS